MLSSHTLINSCSRSSTGGSLEVGVGRAPWRRRQVPGRHGAVQLVHKTVGARGTEELRQLECHLARNLRFAISDHVA